MDVRRTSRKRRIFILANLIALGVAGLVGLAVIRPIHFATLPGTGPVTISGSVLADNSDPTKQNPLAGATVTAEEGDREVSVRSDPSGFFRLALTRGLQFDKPVVLTFSCPRYKTLELTTSTPGDRLYVARLEPVDTGAEAHLSGVRGTAKTAEIKNVRIRYSYKEQSMMSVGSLAKQFRAANTGNVPCDGKGPCSPDGRWKATKTTLSLDAEEGSQFSDVRVSCIAGPCAFTKIDPDHFGQPVRKITASILNWSDTTDFLVEADVSKTMVTDVVRDSYPFIVGQTISFALPPSSEGPSIEADLDGQEIVFPLGPALILEWGSCSVEVSANRDKIYRCQVKPGFRLGS